MCRGHSIYWATHFAVLATIEQMILNSYFHLLLKAVGENLPAWHFIMLSYLKLFSKRFILILHMYSVLNKYIHIGF